MDSLLEGSIDIAAVSLHTVHRDLEYQPFLEDQVVLVVPCDHPWADGRTVKPDDLLEGEYILARADRRFLRSVGRGSGRSWAATLPICVWR